MRHRIRPVVAITRDTEQSRHAHKMAPVLIVRPVLFEESIALGILHYVRKFVTDERRLQNSGPSAQLHCSPEGRGGSERWHMSSPSRALGRRTRLASKSARSIASTRMTTPISISSILTNASTVA